MLKWGMAALDLLMFVKHAPRGELADVDASLQHVLEEATKRRLDRPLEESEAQTLAESLVRAEADLKRLHLEEDPEFHARQPGAWVDMLLSRPTLAPAKEER